MSLIDDFMQDTAVYRRLHAPPRGAAPWSRLLVPFGSRGLLVLAAHRIAYRYSLVGRAILPRLCRLPFWGVLHLGLYLSKVLGKSEVMSRTRIEGGVYFSDRGHIIVGASSIGSGTVIHDRVTIGRSSHDKGIPEIGRDVWIGPRCIIYGSITVGAGATLLPDTVLTKSIPPRALVHGNPPRVLQLDFDNTDLRNSLVAEVEPPRAQSAWACDDRL